MAFANKRNKVISITMKGDDKLSPALRVAIRTVRAFRLAATTSLNAVRRVAQLVGTAFKVMLGPLGLVTTALSAFSGVALFRLIRSSGEAGDEVAKMSKRFGVAVETLSAYRLASELSGSSIESIARGLKTLAKNVNDFDQGMGEAKDTFEALGINVRTSDGHLRDLDSIMLDIADRFSRFDDETRKAAFAQELFGRAGADLVPLLEEGSDGIRALMHEARELGVVFTEEQAHIAEEYMDSLDRLKHSFAGVRNIVALELMPALTQGLNAFARFIASNRESIRSWAGEVARNVARAALAIKAFGKLLIDLVRDPQQRETLGHVLEILGDAGLDMLKASLAAGVRTLGGFIQAIMKPLVLAAGLLGQKIGEQIWEGIKDPFTTSKSEHLAELESEIAAITRRLELGFMGQTIALDASGRGEGLISPSQLQARLQELRTEAKRLRMEIENELEASTRASRAFMGELFGEGARSIMKGAGAIGEAAAQFGEDAKAALANVRSELEKLGDASPLVKTLIDDLNAIDQQVSDLFGDGPQRGSGMDTTTSSVREFTFELNEMNPALEKSGGLFGNMIEQAIEFANRVNEAKETLSEMRTEAIHTFEIANASGLFGRGGEMQLAIAEFNRATAEIIRDKERQIAELERLSRERLISEEELANHRVILEMTANAQIEALQREHNQRLRELNGSFFEGFTDESRRFLDTMSHEYANGAEAFASLFGTISSGFDSVADSIIENNGEIGDSFDDMGKQILKVLAKILAQQAALAVLGGFGFTDSTGGLIGSRGLFSFLFEKGGIMTPEGPLPLRRYDRGGIARSPQVALFGEGDRAEAYVPLPDGRHIPVRMQGGGDVTIINNSWTIKALDGADVKSVLTRERDTVEEIVADKYARSRNYRERLRR